VRGEPLFAVTSAEIAALEAEGAKARVEVEAARSTFERVRALVATRAVPAKEETSARHELEEAEVAQRLAEAKMQSLKVAPDAGHKFTVQAPRDGVVVEKSVLVDQQVSPDSSGVLMVVADLSSVWVMADVFEAEALAVSPGVAARIRSLSLPGAELDGRGDMVASRGVRTPPARGGWRSSPASAWASPWRRKGRSCSTTSWTWTGEPATRCLRPSSASRCGTRWRPSSSRS